MVDQHTVRAYDKDLDLLERRIAEMGGLGLREMVIDAVDALASGDTPVLAHQVVENRSAARPASARDRGAGDTDHRAPAAGGELDLARDHRRHSGRGRSRAGRGSGQEHRQALGQRSASIRHAWR